MKIDQDDTKSLIDELNNIKKSIKKPNILVLGGTGVGKSSLINKCFGVEISSTGIGRPVTQRIEKFANDDFPIVLFDSKGYEIGTKGESEFTTEIIQYAHQSKIEQNPIHLGWYCIQASGGRITEYDILTIKQLEELGTPTAVVLTKAELLTEEEAKKFKEVIKNELPNISIFEVSAKNDSHRLDIDNLCQWSINNLPAAEKFAFAAAQKNNFLIKQMEVEKIITQHITGSAFIGFSPIPFSDAPLLLSNQIAMCARILSIYNLESISKTINTTLITSAVGAAISQSGIWIVAQFFKIFPGVGSIGGGLINGAVASSITYAIGKSIGELCEHISKNEINLDEGTIELFLKNFEKTLSKHAQS